MLTHENIIVSAQNGNKFDGFTPDDILLAYLPMAWVGDHIFSYGQAYARGHVRVLPREPRDRGRGPARDRPDLFLRAAARVREPAHPDHGAHGGRGLAQEAHVPLFPRRGAALRRGNPERQAGRRLDRLLYWLGDLLVYAPLRNRMGFSRTARRLHRRRGHRPRAVQLLPLARHQPEAALRPDRGQRLHHPAARWRGLSRHRRQAGSRTSRSKSPTTARCCSRAPAYSSSITRTTRRPAATKTPDGWVHTGDAGFFDQRGHLKIIDRAKDVGRLNNGALFAPKYLENRIKFYPEVREAVAFGHGRDYVTMLINIDLDLGRQLGRAQQRRPTPAIRSWPPTRRSTRSSPSGWTS